MLLQIITFYCVCDAFLLEEGHTDPPRTQMTQAEVMTTALVAAEFFGGNLRRACQYLKESGLIPRMLAESRFNRRLHRVSPAQWQGLLTRLGHTRTETTFLLDSCPVPVCRLARAARSKLYAQERAAYFGYCPAKDERFFGLKAHVVTSASGRPVEVLLLCGCSHDLIGFAELRLDLPQGSQLLADKGYTDYTAEDRLFAEEGIRLLALRKSNSKRPRAETETDFIRRTRKRIETTFSQVSTRLARRIHAVTEAGFESKVMAAFVAYALVGIAS